MELKFTPRHATLRLPGTTPLSRPSRKATEEGWHRLAKSLNYILRTRGQESPKGESRKPQQFGHTPRRVPDRLVLSFEHFG